MRCVAYAPEKFVEYSLRCRTRFLLWPLRLPVGGTLVKRFGTPSHGRDRFLMGQSDRWETRWLTRATVEEQFCSLGGDQDSWSHDWEPLRFVDGQGTQ